jgi:hypothetical protein
MFGIGNSDPPNMIVEVNEQVRGNKVLGKKGENNVFDSKAPQTDHKKKLENDEDINREIAVCFGFLFVGRGVPNNRLDWLNDVQPLCDFDESVKKRKDKPVLQSILLGLSNA